jgi:hypothetical protein
MSHFYGMLGLKLFLSGEDATKFFILLVFLKFSRSPKIQFLENDGNLRKYGKLRKFQENQNKI